ncbi:MAG: hypothetical protein OXF83_09160 [Anaerolineaceae bacterium]|nr:hypothetical protein [Anaerolineaceae bacterium]MCY3936512.1 hypothetical protein [Chloroflexota bacterium]MCY4009246.1 hypothetical protein [Anaerolineaceae bacterium]
MTVFRAALTALAALELPGLRANYDLTELPETLSSAQLPALLTLPGETPDGALSRPLFGNRAAGFEAQAFRGSAATVTLHPWHLLLLAPLGEGLGLRSHLPRLVDLLDAYLEAIAVDLTLGGRLLEPTQLEVEVGVFPYASVAYHGCRLRHTWKLALG